ncbi:PREDICTED: protein aveugle [Nicrophorus vespilloides]|uniref:Protein aveugle n=1 Tax=Nicrophorus vespilloides TaxID=110193 RepID=A0ABM1MSK7_NICVS|nr:PREDICTED: protein aveugle [Nicrophorus vespilloides]
MVEETCNTTNKPKVKTTHKPKYVYLWTVLDVQRWFRRRCELYYPSYHQQFLNHEITGRALLRFNNDHLLRLGITNKEHREAIWEEILKLKLKNDIMDIRDLQRSNMNMVYDYAIA